MRFKGHPKKKLAFKLFCSACGKEVIGTKNHLLKLVQEEVTGVTPLTYYLHISYICPSDGRMTSFSQRMKNDNTELLKSINLYTDTLEGNE